MTDIAVAPAQAADMEIVEALLLREHLPLDGLREYPQQMLVARRSNVSFGKN